MQVKTVWHGDNFNVILTTKEGAEPFLEIKGCRIVNGRDGQFVSYPSRKLESGKYWNHVYGSERFNAVVLEKANANRPAPPESRRSSRGDEMGDITF